MTLIASDIEQMEILLANGIKNNDLEFLDKVIYNDFLGLAPNGQLITKEMDMASHRAGTMVIYELATSVEDIRITGDTAVVMVIYKTKGKMFGNPIEGTFKYNRVWKQFDDGPKVISLSCIQVE